MQFNQTKLATLSRIGILANQNNDHIAAEFCHPDRLNFADYENLYGCYKLALVTAPILSSISKSTY